MWYAIEYAYGSTVVNNGNRADRVLEFTRRQLRDAWVAVGDPQTDAPGYREAAPARHPLVRKADVLDDGDAEGWRVLAQRRLDRRPELAAHLEAIGYEWPEKDHAIWVATAPEREIISWAKEIEKAQQP